MANLVAVVSGEHPPGARRDGKVVLADEEPIRPAGDDIMPTVQPNVNTHKKN